MGSTSSKIIRSYDNGDYHFDLHNDGTLIRTTESENPKVKYPSSIDIKITDYCDMGCAFCHESSTKEGKHCSFAKLITILEEIPGNSEIAIGGGNPLSHPWLYGFLEAMENKGFISNLTVNQGHLGRYYEVLEDYILSDMIRGLGISINGNNFEYVKKLKKFTDNIVYHVIAGVHEVEVVNKLLSLGDTKVLILGYKDFGFGKSYRNPEVDRKIKEWEKYFPYFMDKATISFDNLAIEQLDVKRMFTKEGWEKFYMGDDFEFTMYIDAVKQEYAKTSRSEKRIPFSEMTLLEFFHSTI